jgi:PD-(D/E)XK endonuclease
MTRAGSGNAGEAMVLAALVRKGLHILVPFGEDSLGDASFLRVQCKTARPQRGCLVFNPHTTDHGRGRQSYAGRADIFGVYFPPFGSVYLVPIGAVTRFSGRLRLKPTLNNQQQRVRYAADFEIDRWTIDSLREIVQVEAPRDERALSVA